MTPSNQAVEPSYQRYRRFFNSATEVLKKPKSKNYIGAILTFLAIALFGWYAIRPTVQTIFFLQREIQDKEELNSKMENKIRELIEAQAAYQNIESQLPVLDEAVPQTPNLVETVLSMQTLAENAGATISGIQASEVPLMGEYATASAVKNKNLNDFTLATIAKGSFPQLLNFISELSQIRRIISIESLNFTPATDLESVPSGSASGMLKQLKLILNTKSYFGTR